MVTHVEGVEDGRESVSEGGLDDYLAEIADEAADFETSTDVEVWHGGELVVRYHYGPRAEA